jgi:hypothetical protein
VLGLDQAAQTALLAAMFGSPSSSAPARSAATSFHPVGVRIHRTPRGSLCCRSLPFPDTSIMAADSPRLCLRMQHEAFNSRWQPRDPDAVAELEALIATHAPRRGVVTIPFLEPRAWGLRTVRDVMARAIEHLPTVETVRPNYTAAVSAPSRVTPRGSITVWCDAGEVWCYEAEVELAPGATKAIERWCSMLYPGEDPSWCGGSIAEIDARLNRVADQADPQADAALDDDEDDWIERTARRTLHAGAGTGDVDRLLEKVRRVAIRPTMCSVLEGIIDRLLDSPGGAR